MGRKRKHTNSKMRKRLADAFGCGIPGPCGFIISDDVIMKQIHEVINTPEAIKAREIIEAYLSQDDVKEDK